MIHSIRDPEKDTANKENWWMTLSIKVIHLTAKNFKMCRNIGRYLKVSFLCSWMQMFQVGERRNKLSTLVGFPLTGLDMAPHVVKRSQSMKNLHQGSSQTNRRPSSGQHQRSDMILPRDYLYDLYAVCNHHGGMHGGHYTGKELQIRE